MVIVFSVLFGDAINPECKKLLCKVRDIDLLNNRRLHPDITLYIDITRKRMYHKFRHAGHDERNDQVTGNRNIAIKGFEWLIIIFILTEYIYEVNLF